MRFHVSFIAGLITAIALISFVPDHLPPSAVRGLATIAHGNNAMLQTGTPMPEGHAIAKTLDEISGMIAIICTLCIAATLYNLCRKLVGYLFTGVSLGLQRLLDAIPFRKSRVHRASPFQG